MMLGKLLSGIVKVATIPVDVTEIVLDVATGGDGSKQSRHDLDISPTKLRDSVCEALEDIDND